MLFFLFTHNGIMTPISNDRLLVISIVSPFENCFREKKYARTLFVSNKVAGLLKSDLGEQSAIYFTLI